MSEITKYINIVISYWPWFVFASGGVLFFWKKLRYAYNILIFINFLYDSNIKQKRDIKEEQEAFQKVHQEYEIRHRIAENKLKTAIYVCDEKGNCIYANEYLCALFGLSSDEMLGTGWLVAVFEEDRIETYDRWMETIEKDIPYTHEYRIKNQQNSKIYYIKTKAWKIYDIPSLSIRYLGEVKLNNKNDKLILEEIEEVREIINEKEI